MQRIVENTITAYPLSWPIGWPRTAKPRMSRYDDKRTIAIARDVLCDEIRLLGGVKVVISSNMPLRDDGRMRSSPFQPRDCGVAVYFDLDDKPVCLACDQWLTVEENLWALKLTVSALRMIKRTGVTEILDRAFSGFLALPAPKTSDEQWWEVLGVSPNATKDEIRESYRKLAMSNHPDYGGSTESMSRLNVAYEQSGMK